MERRNDILGKGCKVMNKETIKVTVKPDGSVEIEGVGFTGQDCTLATEFLEKELGSVTDRKLKPEYNQRPKAEQRREQGA